MLCHFWVFLCFPSACKTYFHRQGENEVSTTFRSASSPFHDFEWSWQHQPRVTFLLTRPFYKHLVHLKISLFLPLPLAFKISQETTQHDST